MWVAISACVLGTWMRLDVRRGTLARGVAYPCEYEAIEAATRANGTYVTEAETWQ
jgi:hypothetical protein